MTIFFRFNCGNMWGLGHLYRNILVMKEIRDRGFQPLAIINNNEIAKHMLTQENIKYHTVSVDEDAKDIINIINDNSINNTKVLFWDRLNSNEDYIKKIINSNIKIITYDNYDKSAILATKCINTRNILVGGKKIHDSGPNYQILNEIVIKYSEKEKHINKTVNNILLHFGGTDPLKIIDLCYNSLLNLKDYNYSFIVGKGEDTKMISLINKSENMKCEQAVNDFAKRIYDADICIVAGGVTMYEVAAIGTPMINISHNEDQNFAATIFSKNTSSINLGIAGTEKIDLIKETVKKISQDYNLRLSMSKKMKEFVKPYGTKMVSNIIEQIAIKG